MIQQDIVFHTCSQQAEVFLVPAILDLIYHQIPDDLETLTDFDVRMNAMLAASNTFTII